MKIDGNTIKFKSNLHFYNLERKGIKPNTVRILEEEEGLEIDKWQKKGFIDGNVYRYIEISFLPENRFFIRTLTWVGKIGVFLGKEIWMFCWKPEQINMKG